MKSDGQRLCEIVHATGLTAQTHWDGLTREQRLAWEQAALNVERYFLEKHFFGKLWSATFTTT